MPARVVKISCIKPNFTQGSGMMTMVVKATPMSHDHTPNLAHQLPVAFKARDHDRRLDRTADPAELAALTRPYAIMHIAQTPPAA
jgi:hypothetical protein